MNLSRRIDQVRAAQARVAAQRAELAAPTAALLARGRRHPWLMLATAGGAGFVLGSVDASPLRVPGFATLLRGGLADLLTQGVRLFAGLGAGSTDDTAA